MGGGAAALLAALGIVKFIAWMRDRVRSEDRDEAKAAFTVEDIQRDLAGVMERVSELERAMSETAQRCVGHGERIGALGDLARSVQTAQKDITDKLDKMVFLLMDLMKNQAR